MIELCLIAACCSSSINRTRATRIHLVLPNFTSPPSTVIIFRGSAPFQRNGPVVGIQQLFKLGSVARMEHLWSFTKREDHREIAKSAAGSLMHNRIRSDYVSFCIRHRDFRALLWGRGWSRRTIRKQENALMSHKVVEMDVGTWLIWMVINICISLHPVCWRILRWGYLKIYEFDESCVKFYFKL